LQRKEIENKMERTNNSYFHDWEKTNLVTITGRGGLSYDNYRCKRCGVTAKRFGLSDDFRRDKKFNTEKFAECIIR